MRTGLILADEADARFDLQRICAPRLYVLIRQCVRFVRHALEGY